MEKRRNAAPDNTKSTCGRRTARENENWDMSLRASSTSETLWRGTFKMCKRHTLIRFATWVVLIWLPSHIQTRTKRAVNHRLYPSQERKEEQIISILDLKIICCWWGEGEGIGRSILHDLEYNFSTKVYVHNYNRLILLLLFVYLLSVNLLNNLAPPPFPYGHHWQNINLSVFKYCEFIFSSINE